MPSAIIQNTTNKQVDEVGKARPEITKATETMIKKGKWTVPGYRVSLLRTGLRLRERKDTLLTRWIGEIRRVLFALDGSHIRMYPVQRRHVEVVIGCVSSGDLARADSVRIILLLTLLYSTCLPLT